MLQFQGTSNIEINNPNNNNTNNNNLRIVAAASNQRRRRISQRPKHPPNHNLVKPLRSIPLVKKANKKPPSPPHLAFKPNRRSETRRPRNLKHSDNGDDHLLRWLLRLF